jgi:uncharacterized protein (DUF433 family)
MTINFRRIVPKPESMFGNPVVGNLRISVSLILGWLASGVSIDDIVKQHPLLTHEIVKEAIQYATLYNKNDIFLELTIESE